jgi:hypothetical protein
VLVFVFVGLTTVGTAFQAVSDAPLTAEDGRRLEEKLVQIFTNAEVAGSRVPEAITLPQREVNAYMRFQAALEFPTGVAEPTLTFTDGGRVTASAVIGLDAVRDSRQRGVLDPLRYVGGAVDVIAVGTLSAADGVGRLAVEAVSIGGVPMPTSVLLELVRFYSRSERRPEGVDPTDPFDVPYGIRWVMITDGLAVISY